MIPKRVNITTTYYCSCGCPFFTWEGEGGNAEQRCKNCSTSSDSHPIGELHYSLCSSPSCEGCEHLK